MLRALVVATLLFIPARAGPGQALSVLHIKVVLVDAERKVTPVPNHALLVSDNPASAAPRLIITALDGTADVRLRPGNYTVESDRPVAFLGKTYQWTQTVDVGAGRDAVLELTADNAEVESVTSSTTTASAPLETDRSAIVMQWQDSVVALWTPTTHASGFVIDAKGLIATNERLIGNATSVEAQFGPVVKVAASVLVADPVRDVAILRIDPAVLASVRAVPLGCGLAAKPPLVDGQEIFTIGVPLRQQKGVTSGTVSHMSPNAMVSALELDRDGTGGPVFVADGSVVGMTSVVDGKDVRRREESRIVRIEDVCTVVASATEKMSDATAPNGTHLPVEPSQPFPLDALKEAAQRRPTDLGPYQMASSDFDITFITPVLAYRAQDRAEQTSRRERSGGTRTPAPVRLSQRALTDFSNWSGYVADFPPVLLIRVTPKLVEGFWTTVARGAAQTQGVSLPALRHVKSGFFRLRAFCGDTEVTPIHPFKLEQRLSPNNAIYEGLYVFDPAALGPTCGTVKLALYSEKEPEKADSRTVDAAVLQQIWQDFTPYRALK
jgi:hypothetical protein